MISADCTYDLGEGCLTPRAAFTKSPQDVPPAGLIEAAFRENRLIEALLFRENRLIEAVFRETRLKMQITSCARCAAHKGRSRES